MPAGGEAESTTKATISEGTIEIRYKENQKQDINKLNRDMTNSLNKLGEIFDKNTVKEKQEFAGLFQEFAHDYIGDLTGKISQDEKAVLNSFIDGLISEWSNGNFLAGASVGIGSGSVSGSVGVNANINNGADYNEKGVTPAIGMPASGEAESTTKATISEGTIEIRDKVVNNF